MAKKNQTVALVNVPATPLAVAWARDPGKHPMDSYLEDAGAMAVQGVTDTREDMSVRQIPSRKPDGTRVITLVGARDEALDAAAEFLSSEDGYEIVKQRVKRPPEDELRKLIQELPAQGIATPDALARRELHALPPVPSDAGGATEASDAALETKVDEAMRSAPDGLSREVVRENIRKLRELGHLGDEPARAGVTEAPASVGGRTVQHTPDAPFVLGIRKGRKVVHEAGPFPKYADAKAALDEWNESAEPGHVTATIYEGGYVAMHHGRAVFERKRTKFVRA